MGTPPCSRERRRGRGDGLCSSESSWIVGQRIPVDGGFSLT
ncbi:MAG: hypothetical protein Q8Q58_00580 [Candidatus Rokubacteria bacterium]|nr:hypothetical protein [Candidatus Rokubacteria bacterium]